MLITFLVSSVFHELIMSCITKKLRGYGFGAMMLQLPIVAVQKSRFFKGRTTLNVSFAVISMRTCTDPVLECLFLVLDDLGPVDCKFPAFPATATSQILTKYYLQMCVFYVLV